MNTRIKIFKKMTSVVVILILMLGLVPLPVINGVGNVYAQTETTPSEEPALAEELTPQTVTEENSTSGSETSAEYEETTGEEAESTVADEEGAKLIEELAIEPAKEPIAESTEKPVEEVAVAEVIEKAAEKEVVLQDESGEQLKMAEQEAADLLAEGDPIIVRAGITYNFLPTGSICVETATNKCFLSNDPLSDAVVFADPGETITVAAGAYDENVLVDKNVILIGGGGGVFVTAFTLSAPVTSLSSWTNIFTDQVYVITDTNSQGRIQDAMDLVSPGGNVEVSKGTYTETVTISKPVTVTGEIGSPTLSGPGADGPVLSSISYGSGTGFTLNSNFVTIQGFAIYGFLFGVNLNNNGNINLNNNALYGLPSNGEAFTGGTPVVDEYNIKFYTDVHGGDGYQNDCDASADCLKTSGNVDDGGEFDYALWGGRPEVVVIKAGTQEHFYTPDTQSATCPASLYSVTWDDINEKIVVERCDRSKDISHIQFWNMTPDQPEPERYSLILVPTCGCVNGDLGISWAVENPNSFSVDVNWSLDGNSGTSTLAPGTTTNAFTSTGSSEHTLSVSWEFGEASRSFTGACVCRPDPKDPGDPTREGKGLLIPVTGSDLGVQALLPAGSILLVGLSFILKGILEKNKKNKK